MRSLFTFGMFIIGIVQFAAVVSGFVELLGGFFGILAAFILGEMPILGTIMGVVGATQNWEWPILPALLLFLGTPVTLFIVGSISERRV